MRPITKLTMCAFVAAAVTAPAVAASTDFYLTLGDIKGESTDRIGNPVPRGGGKRIEITSWSFGATQKGWDGTIKGPPGTEKFGAVSGAHRDADVAGDPVLSKVEGGRTDAATTITSPRDAASGLPTGKRQHQPKGLPRALDQAKPLDQGSVTINGSFPSCSVGAAYADATLQVAAARYELKDVQITSCSPDSVSLNYAKVQVRGWDPATKKE